MVLIKVCSASGGLFGRGWLSQAGSRLVLCLRGGSRLFSPLSFLAICPFYFPGLCQGPVVSGHRRCWFQGSRCRWCNWVGTAPGGGVITAGICGPAVGGCCLWWAVVPLYQFCSRRPLGSAAGAGGGVFSLFLPALSSLLAGDGTSGDSLELAAVSQYRRRNCRLRAAQQLALLVARVWALRRF